jgi:isopenicillin-N epimerase
MDPLLSRRAVLGALGAAAAFGPALAQGQTFTADGVPGIPRFRWRWVAAQLVLQPGLLWFDTATFGPTLRAVLVRSYRHLEEQSLDFRRFEAQFGAGSPEERAVLGSAALFLGADPGELVPTDGARTGLGLVAAGLDLAAGDEVLVTLHDHAAATYPWLAQVRRRGIRVVEVREAAGEPHPAEIVERFAAAMTPRTRVMCIAHVQDCDGVVMPVRELCALARSRGVFSIVDGTLAPGHIDVRLVDLGCDAYTTGLDRWLNGPLDAGLLYVRRDSQSMLWPASPDRPDGWRPTDRFEMPVPPVMPDYAAAAKFGAGSLLRRGAAISAMPIAFEFQDAVGRPLIQQRIRELAAQLRSGLQAVGGLQVVTPSHPALNAGIVTVRMPGRDVGVVVDSLAQEDGIVVARVRHGAGFDAIRISIHPSHDSTDIDRCVAALQRRV